MKTVGDLKRELESFDDSLPVAVYVEIGEDMDWFHSVRLETREGPTSYCKGGHVLHGNGSISKVLVIK